MSTTCGPWSGEDVAYDWAEDFDSRVRDWVLREDVDPIIQCQHQGKAAAQAINSAEHYKPLLYVLGAREPGEPVRFFAEKIRGGSLSMRSLRIG